MTITLNGEKKEIPEGLTVRALLEYLDIKPERVAVEINEEIVRKAAYGDAPVREGDRVEVVQFMGGGAEGRGDAATGDRENENPASSTRFSSL